MNLKFLTSSIFCAHFVYSVTADFFGDLDKMDVDSQLNEIDKMLNTIDTNEQEAMDKLVRNKQAEDEDMDMEDVLGALSSLLGGGDCQYKCKNGNKPKPRKGHKPSSNGCGSFGIQIDISDVPGMESCCDDHDHCYDTCNSSREKCDSRFKECLYNTCTRLKKSAPLSQKDCKAGASIMFGGASTMGCQAFLDAQEKACTCENDAKTNIHTKQPKTINKSAQNKQSVKQSSPKKDDIHTKQSTLKNNKDNSREGVKKSKASNAPLKPKDEL